MNGQSRFGCFGCLWLTALACATVFEIALLWWLSPTWFERLMIWQDKPYPPEIAVLPAGGDDALPPPPPLPDDPEVVGYREENTVTGHYREATGARLTTIEGATFEFPPGCMAGDQEIELIPVTEVPRPMKEEGLLLGPVYDLRIGGAEHRRFTRPVRVSVPFVRERLPEEIRSAQVVVGTWREGRWHLHPTRVDADGRTVTAELDHACLVMAGLLLVGGSAVVGVVVSEPFLGGVMYVMEWPDDSYKTTSFAIYYDRKGDHRVPTDAEYPLARGRPSGAQPLFVRDLGRFLEEIREAMPRVKMTVAKAWALRWDVYVKKLSADGMSGLGGPMVLDNDFKIYKTFPEEKKYEYLIRKTCAHELMHVAQDDHFSMVETWGKSWWLETTAEYLALRLLEQLKHSDPDPCRYTGKYPNLLEKHPWVGSKPPKSYAYARFLQWMEGRKVDVVAAVDGVNRSWTRTLENFDSELRKAGSGTSLGDHLVGFAEHMYHRNLWTGELVPTKMTNKFLDFLRTDFNTLTWRPRGKNKVVMRIFAEDHLTLPAFTSKYYHLRIAALPAHRQAKLVVHLSSAAAMSGHVLSLGGMKLSGAAPFSGAPTPMRRVALPGTSHQVLDRRLASPAADAQDVNRVSLIVTNTATSGKGSPLTLRRWLLMPPEQVFVTAFQNGRYQVAWSASELREHPEAFSGYNVYRRRWSDSEFPEQPLNKTPITGEFFLDEPPPGDWDYTITVVDALDNESEPAPLLEGDPFAGTWSGKIRIKRGGVTEPVMRWVRSELSESGEGADSSQIGQALNQLRFLLEKVDFMLHLGLPLTIEVRREGTSYFLKPVRFFGMALEDQEEVEMAPLGRRALVLVADGKKTDRGAVRLYSKDRVKQTHDISFNDPDLGHVGLTVGIDFKRQAQDEVPR